MEKLVKSFKSQIKSINETDYTAEVIVSTEEIDRDKDKIRIDAFKKRLKYYKEHPVLLSSHQYGDLRKQIGEAENIKVTNEGLVAKFKYYVNQNNPEADWAWILATKNIAGYSVGFIPFNYEEKDLEKDGYNREFTDVELVEISQVLIPSNREAVQIRRQIVKNLNNVETELLELAVKSFVNGELKEMVTKPIEETEEYYRFRIRNPDDFVNLRTIWFSEEQGIRAIVGRLKTDPEGSTHTQAILFVKEKWTKERAQKWIDEHKDELKNIVEDITISRGILPYKETPKADENADWDAGEEVAKAEVNDLKIMCVWYDSENPDLKGSYKLPHHRASGEHPVVWNGVRTAMAVLFGARGGADIPEDDRKGAYNHLAKHYKQFDKEVPEFKTAEVLEIISENIDTIVKMIMEKIKTNKHYTQLLFGDGAEAQTSLTRKDIVKLVQEAVK